MLGTAVSGVQYRYRVPMKTVFKHYQEDFAKDICIKIDDRRRRINAGDVWGNEKRDK